MYNLLIGRIDGRLPRDRILEYTGESAKSYVSPDGTLRPERLQYLPTLALPELQDSEVRQVAQVGNIERLAPSGRDYVFRFVPSSSVPQIPSERVSELRTHLEIEDWEFNRTHWAVKEVDLYRVLHEEVWGTPRPRVFSWPVHERTEADLVAVMMPFASHFGPVYSALQEAARDAGLRCTRADDIWEQDHIMDDVVSLIWRARVVICDFSEKNANVFYEAGLAHSLGRSVIQIARSIDDVPFDLRSIRTLTYLANGEGLHGLRDQTADRLRRLISREE